MAATAIEGTVASVELDSIERDEDQSKELAIHGAVNEHLTEVNKALIEAARPASEFDGLARSGNSMLTTFKVMQLVIKVLRESEQSRKKENKDLKEEWKTTSVKQSKNNEESRDNVEGSTKWQYFSLAGTQAKFLADKAVLPAALFALGQAQGFGLGQAATAITWLNDNKDAGLKMLEASQAQIGTALGQMGQQTVQMQQYQLGIKESIFQGTVQSQTSDYQNGTQEQSSNKQAVDGALDMAKQVIRSEGDKMTGRGGG